MRAVMKTIYVCSDMVTGIFSGIYDAWKTGKTGILGYLSFSIIFRQGKRRRGSWDHAGSMKDYGKDSVVRLQ